MAVLPDKTNGWFPAPTAIGANFTMHEHTHLETASPGYERRDVWFPTVRRSWSTIAYGTSTADTKRIWDFFHAKRGRAIGFIGFDPEDYQLKYVRFTSDRLTIRHSGWSARCGAKEIGTIAYDADVGMIELWPGGEIPNVASDPDPPATTIPTNPGYVVDFPSQFAFNAEMWCEFKTSIITTSQGQEWRYNECGTFPRYGATINVQLVSDEDATAIVNFFFSCRGRWKSFWFNLPGIYAGTMHFAQDQIQLVRKDYHGLSVRMDIISHPEQGEWAFS